MGLEAARARYGDAISDEQLLLRMMLPEQQVEAIVPPGRRRPLPPDRHPLRSLVEGLIERSLDDVVIVRPGLRLRACRGRAA